MSDIRASIEARLFQRAAEAGFQWPEGWAVSDLGMCRSCRAQILWCITPSGAAAPVDPDGHSHYATCPQADQWRKR